MVDQSFWHDKKVFLTGHTGFKGSWLSLWLKHLGAKVYGYALAPPTSPSLFASAGISDLVDSTIADIRDFDSVTRALRQAEPDIVIHMAAQPLVRDSYKDPVKTYATNVMGTVHLLEAVRQCPTVRAVVNVTSDKCYENREWHWGYREHEAMGGYDPYSSSKGCSELVTAAYRRSFFNPNNHAHHSGGIASARAGNVIGGGDWAHDRLIPDCLAALLNGQDVIIRSPQAIRPWQHVLEPLSGYLVLAQCLYENGADYADAWNFGPEDSDAKPVEWIVARLCQLWGHGAGYRVDYGSHPHEATYLKLDCSKARSQLNWSPRWSLERTLESIVEWTTAYQQSRNVHEICLEQILEYEQKG